MMTLGDVPDQGTAHKLLVNSIAHAGDPIAELDGIREIITARAEEKLRTLDRLVQSSFFRAPRIWRHSHPHPLWYEPISDIWRCVPCGRAWTAEELVRTQNAESDWWRGYQALINYSLMGIINPADARALLKGITTA